MSNGSKNAAKLFPVMFSFFVMGFVDMVGISTNYVKADFGLSDTMANFLPSMVFLWFFFLSVPTSMLMNRIGKRKTVVLSLGITALALLVPLFGYSYPVMLCSFCLLGIGNTLMQVSLNPLISCIVKGEKLASSLTFGQFVKAIASFIAPIIASWAAVKFGNWRILYAIFLVIAVIATVCLMTAKVEEDTPAAESSSLLDIIKLLGIPSVLLLFFGIVCHVGIDVGVNTCAPKILMERLAMPLTEAAFATSLYFLVRTIGCFTGSFILSKWDATKFFALSVAMMIIGILCLFVCHSKIGLYIGIALMGYGNSNEFSIIFSKALHLIPGKDNEISGLMIMGLIGGTVFPLLMGILSDALSSQIGSVIAISIAVIYLAVLAYRFFKVKAEA